MGGNDASEAVVEVAWADLTTQQEAELKDLLAAEVLENDKLRKSLQVYRKMYDKLRDKLSSSEFLHQLVSNEGEKPLDPSVVRGGDQEKGLRLFVSDDNVLPKEERDELGTNEGYVLITQQDIVDGVACFVARSISSLPQSKGPLSDRQADRRTLPDGRTLRQLGSE